MIAATLSRRFPPRSDRAHKRAQIGVPGRERVQRGAATRASRALRMSRSGVAGEFSAAL
jgi:hypothetical protein